MEPANNNIFAIVFIIVLLISKVKAMVYFSNDVRSILLNLTIVSYGNKTTIRYFLYYSNAYKMKIDMFEAMIYVMIWLLGTSNML